MKKQQTKSTSKTPKKQDKKEFIYKENMKLKDISESLGVSLVQVIQKLLTLGISVNINTVLDKETVELLVLELGYTFRTEEEAQKIEEEIDIEKDDEKDLIKRSPIITIMGHVDHGKTTLLDTIRKANVVDGESGGITQHIGAYQVKRKNELLTFIDTPGHAAFTEMRLRGAKVTDIVVLVVAADDGIQPQTLEAIDHAKAAKVPIIVAINKIDKPGAKPEQVTTKLAEIGIVPDTWGGDYQFVEISAKQNQNIDDLLDTILLVAEMQELKANPNKKANGTVVEAFLDKGRGAVATIIINGGTLKKGDFIVAGTTCGKIRTITSDKGEQLKKAIPSQPVEITGLQDVPEAGDKFMIYETEKLAKSTAAQKQIKQKADNFNKSNITADAFAKLKNSEDSTLNLIIKADVKGSLAAIENLLSKIKNESLTINIVSQSVGAPNENDLSLALATNSMLIVFNVSASAATKKMAREKGVEIKQYRVIYKIEEDISKALKGMMEPEYEKVVIGEAVVRDTFKNPKNQQIAGIFVNDGLIKRKAKATIIREGKIIYEGKIESLKHLKDDKKELKAGLEGGLIVTGYNDFKVDDVIECFELKEQE